MWYNINVSCIKPKLLAGKPLENVQLQGGEILQTIFPHVIAVTGHYGSGKTNFSNNLAISIAKNGTSVTIVDLDIVNPYFRPSAYADKVSALTGLPVRFTCIPEFCKSDMAHLNAFPIRRFVKMPWETNA